MSYIDKHFRISEKICKDFEDEAKRKDKSLSELANDAFEHYLTCKKTERTARLIEIPLKYSTTCLRCKRKLEQGTWVFWGRGVGVICGDCFATRYGNKAIAHLIVREKELRHAIKALTQEIDEKAGQLRNFNFYEIIERLYQENQETIKLANQFLKEDFDKPDKADATLEQLIAKMIEIKTVLDEATEFMRVPLKPKKKRKKKVQQ